MLKFFYQIKVKLDTQAFSCGICGEVSHSLSYITIRRFKECSTDRHFILFVCLLDFVVIVFCLGQLVWTPRGEAFAKRTHSRTQLRRWGCFGTNASRCTLCSLWKLPRLVVSGGGPSTGARKCICHHMCTCLGAQGNSCTLRSGTFRSGRSLAAIRAHRAQNRILVPSHGSRTGDPSTKTCITQCAL